MARSRIFVLACVMIALVSVAAQTHDKPMKSEGEEFVVDRMATARRGGYDMTTLEGGFFGPSTREFKAGSFFVDIALPMANAAFYYLEPQSADGFVGWGPLDGILRERGVDAHPVVYPIFKYRKSRPERETRGRD